MEKEANSVMKAISDTIAQAVGDEDFALPLAAWQTTALRSDETNVKYAKEAEDYQRAPVAPCSRSTSLKLLRRFARKDFRHFWTMPVAEYLPAVSEGTMKLCETVYPHDEAVCYAKELIATLSHKDLAKDFLYGVAHNAPEYRTALACYYYIKNLPEHAFERKYVGTAVGKNGEWEDRYNEEQCEICGYQHAVSTEPKMQFWHVNMDIAGFYFYGRMERSSLNIAILFLEEYKKLPRPACSETDYAYFKKVVEVIEHCPENTTSGKLRKELKQSGLLSMTLDQIEMLVNMLGYLNILHPDDSHGMIFTHTCQRDMLYPLSDRGYAEHPVNRWTRQCGIDYGSMSMLFDGIYD